ncbi:MAG: zinc ribbon domain-containing protein [Ignavibacteriales bacterium]|nr:zinc ribbon domain-containing protein [Ignavibacteriales bacterium]MCF8305217.1 zinc ribbon domain-containing protein [Ignavibacteriales bacterium]MCF8314870.1 zinc ribbon domain-containing protein [Ignavibacteriales bacterium]MCF8436181.1 zinc ribbon domain-containing protein [Ignavibacteriales bacterium]
MPTYDYKCENCGHKFELFQKMSDTAITVCPECSGTVKRLIGSGLAPIFKGSGFYQTDYKNSSTNASTPAKTETQKEKPKESAAA